MEARERSTQGYYRCFTWHNLNSIGEVIEGIIYGTPIGVIKGTLGV